MAADRRRVPAAAALALVFACVTILGTAGSAGAATVSVRGIFNGTRFVWTPKVREIVPGTSIRWRAVHCTIHGNVVNGVCSGMCGRIVVS
jgi:plastocyanin